MEEESSAEIQAKLEVYRSQLKQLADALKIDSKNDELKNMYDQLGQVVALTETMLQLRLQQERETEKHKQQDVVLTKNSTIFFL